MSLGKIIRHERLDVETTSSMSNHVETYSSMSNYFWKQFGHERLRQKRHLREISTRLLGRAGHPCKLNARYHLPEEYVIFTDKPLYRPDSATIHTCSIPAPINTWMEKPAPSRSSFSKSPCPMACTNLFILASNVAPTVGIAHDVPSKNCAPVLKTASSSNRRKSPRHPLSRELAFPMESILYVSSFTQCFGGCSFNEIVLNERIDLDVATKPIMPILRPFMQTRH